VEAVPTVEHMNVTRRAWMMAAVGALLAATLGGFVVTRSGSSAPFKPLASWGAFTPAQWKSLSARLEKRGFTASSIHVVESVQNDRHMLTLVAATTARGHTCFVPVHGVTLAQSICHMTKPVVLYTAPDYWLQPTAFGKPAHRIPLTDVLGVARRDIAGISVEQLLEGHRSVQGLPLIENGGVLTFAGSFADLSVLRARNADGRVLFRLAFSR
jgi:hypothetical protein